MTIARVACSLSNFLALLATAGCGGADYEAKRPSTSDSVVREQLTLSRPVLLIGDNQVQHLFGKGVIERTGLADYLARTAIRPVQLDMFAHQLFLDACQAVPDYPIIHLGDAANSACVQELDLAFALMQACGEGRPWVMAPGNHDAFLMGSVHRTCRLQEWADACYDFHGPDGNELAKDVLVKKILLRTWAPRLHKGHELECEEPKSEQDISKCVRGRVVRSESDSHPDSRWNDFLVEATFHVNEDAPWQSFVLQLVDLTAPSNESQPVFALVVDTVHYEDRPRVWPQSQDPGTTGAIEDAQRDAIKRTLLEHQQALFLFVGHHPLEKLQEDSRTFVLELAHRETIAAYVSGHTHLGRWYGHPVEGRKEDFVELNVGSITDHPNEYRDLLLGGVGRDEEPSLVWLTSRINPKRTRPLCEPGSLPDPSEYLAYRNTPFSDSTKLQRQLLRSQAKAWIHFLLYSGFESDDSSRIGHLEDALALPDGEGGDEVLRKACSDVAADVFPRLDRTSPPLSAQTKSYMRCVAYEAARYEGRPSPREVARRIVCAKEQNLRAATDPFVRATEWMRVADLRGAGESSEQDDE